MKIQQIIWNDGSSSSKERKTWEAHNTSSPKTAGWFGREGLSIVATVGFPKGVFEEYVAQLNDTDVWQPVPYLKSSPSRGGEYSKMALRWSDLPLPAPIQERLQRIELEPQVMEVRHGKYYCSVLLTVRGEPLQHNPAAYSWRYVGKSYAELTPSEHIEVLILSFAVLDYENKVMHACIKFSF